MSNAQKFAIMIGLLKSQVKPRGNCSYKNCCGCSVCYKSCEVPITEIDGIKDLYCSIKVWNDRIVFSVEAQFKYEEELDTNPDLYFKMKYNADGITTEQILEFTTSLIEEIPLLKMDANGKLSPNNIDISCFKTIDTVFSSLASKTVVVDCMKECCVCYEKTKTKTPCKHCLCNRCWSKIKSDDDEDGNIPCPLCRENIYYV